MLVHISIGDKVSPGDPFFTLFSDNEKALKKKVKEIGERVKLRMENGELRIEN
jgi:thymidine phosphorylase